MRLQTYETTATTITSTLPTQTVVVIPIWERDHRLEEEGAEITPRTTTETLTTIDFNLAGLLSIRGQKPRALKRYENVLLQITLLRLPIQIKAPSARVPRRCCTTTRNKDVRKIRLKNSRPNVSRPKVLEPPSPTPVLDFSSPSRPQSPSRASPERSSLRPTTP